MMGNFPMGTAVLVTTLAVPESGYLLSLMRALLTSHSVFGIGNEGNADSKNYYPL